MTTPSLARRRGRPPRRVGAESATGRDAMSRELILERATQMARVEPLGEISMVGLARELGVAPTLIHYYVGSRADLIAGVANRYFQARHARRQPLTGDWQADLRREARLTFEMGQEYGGVLRYFMTHNRNRLFQDVGPGETDFGVLYFDRIGLILRDAGFTAQQAALAYHLLSQFLISSSFAQVTRQLPAFHEAFILARMAELPRKELAGAHFLAESFAAIDADAEFDVGLDLMLAGFACWIHGHDVTRRASSASRLVPKRAKNSGAVSRMRARPIRPVRDR
jgi:AcrR family transcriptional regulator